MSVFDSLARLTRLGTYVDSGWVSYEFRVCAQQKQKNIRPGISLFATNVGLILLLFQNKKKHRMIEKEGKKDK